MDHDMEEEEEEEYIYEEEEDFEYHDGDIDVEMLSEDAPETLGDSKMIRNLKSTPYVIFDIEDLKKRLNKVVAEVSETTGLDRTECSILLRSFKYNKRELEVRTE